MPRANDGTVPFGGGMHPYMMAPGGVHEQVWTALADKLGLTYDELIAALQSGQTIADLAETKSVSLDELKQTALDAKRAALALMMIQMPGTFLVLILRPQEAFIGGNLLHLSVVGEFVIKNLVLIAAGITIGGHVLPFQRTAPDRR